LNDEGQQQMAEAWLELEAAQQQMAGAWSELRAAKQETPEELEDGATQQEAPEEPDIEDEADDQP
jgi:anthranilate phosphoribosyltransferase